MIGVVLCGLMVTSSALLAAETATNSLADFGDLSLEQLVNIQVTSVSKKETALIQSPAAISVITTDDIRRLGVTSIPEALRMVPGMDVGQITGNKWAVSARGFNSEFAFDMLVLIDGRTVYTPASSGVFWESQDVVMEDLSRIEVIRGPGATLWGANAVNGVVNIITKSAKETQGGLASTSFGTEDQPIATVRYGGELASNLYYRVFVKYASHPELETSTGGDAADGSSLLHGGFRIDYEPATRDTFTFQGDYYNGNDERLNGHITLDPAAVQTIKTEEHNSGANVLGRWTRDFSEDSQMTLQTYFDHVQQGDGFGVEIRNTFDIDLQHRFALGSRNDIVWGAGYRYADLKNTPSFNITWTPESRELQLGNFFMQDDITILRDRLHFTLGSKFEYNNLIGFEIEPSARLLWTPTEHQTVWSAISRATRTPAVFDLNARLNEAAFPSGPPPSPAVLVSLLGNPNLEAENLTAYEIGYRIEPVKSVSFDATAFYNVYGNLITQVPNNPGFEDGHLLISSTWQNLDSGYTYGSEISAQWQVLDNWRLMASYTFLSMHLGPGQSFPPESSSPQQQFQIRSYLDLPHNVEFNGAIYYTDQITTQSGGDMATIPSYIKLDLGLMWRPYKFLEIGVWGKNLLDGGHPEFPSQETSLITEIPRSVMGRVTLRF